MKELYTVIMAGGSGTRFWPLSRETWPKQMLKIVGETTMITQTIKRVKGLTARNNICIVTTSSQASDITLHTKGTIGFTPAIISEPSPRNTAPAIGLAAVYLRRADSDAMMLVLPADHYIKNEKTFRATVRRAVSGALEGKLVTIGIRPVRPDTGYGYIRCGVKIDRDLFNVKSFVEKPDRRTAERYLEAGDYYWNSGIFIWKADAILNEMKLHMPLLYRGLKRIEKVLGTRREERVVNEVYDSFEKVSIDYGVMERSKKVLMVAGSFDWSDVGNWSALDDLLRKDRRGNIIRKAESVIDIKSRNCTIHAADRIIATIGLQDMIVVDTADATLICPKEKCQDVKKVVEELEKRGREERLVHRTVERPWGSYTVLEAGMGYKIKRIYVRPGGRLSLQYHNKRSEHWVVVAGTARVTRGKEIFNLPVNESTYIPIGVLHRLENPGEGPVQIIEVQNGSYVEEDDIVRVEDVYGR